MRNSDRYTESRLPVALMLVGPEIAVPSRHAVKFGEHTLIAELVNRRLRLLRRCEFMIIAKHIYAGNIKAPVGAHSLAECGTLTAKRRLLHHVSCQGNTVFAAP